MNGKPQRARFRPFHGDVVIVSSLGGEIQSLPLSNLIHRLPDVQVLLLRLRLPTTAGVVDDAGPFSAHWRAEFAGGQALFGLHRPGGRCTIAGVSFPCLILGTGELVDPSLEEMQQYWDRLLAPLFGACILCDTGASDGSRPVFVQCWSLPGRLPWISRLPTGVDVVVADPGGAGLDEPTPGKDWHLRPVLRSTWFGLASYTAFCTGPLAPFQSLEGVLPAVLETPPQQPAQTAAVGSRLPWAHDAASAEHTTPPVSVHASSGASGSASQRRSQPSSQQASTSLSGTIDSATDAGGYGGRAAAVADEGTLSLPELPREAAVNTSAGHEDTLAHPHHSLLQVSLHLTKAADTTPGSPVKASVGSSMCLKVWTPTGQAPPIAFVPDARAGEVSELVARALGPSHGAHSLYPVFAPQAYYFMAIGDGPALAKGPFMACTSAFGWKREATLCERSPLRAATARPVLAIAESGILSVCNELSRRLETELRLGSTLTWLLTCCLRIAPRRCACPCPLPWTYTLWPFPPGMHCLLGNLLALSMHCTFLPMGPSTPTPGFRPGRWCALPRRTDMSTSWDACLTFVLPGILRVSELSPVKSRPCCMPMQSRRPQIAGRHISGRTVHRPSWLVVANAVVRWSSRRLWMPRWAGVPCRGQGCACYSP